MATTIALTQCDSNLWHGSLAVSVEQLCTVEDDSVVLLTCTWQESWYVYERYDRNIEGIAETNEAGCLAASVYIEYTCVSCWLVGYDTNALTIEAGETCNDVLGELRLNFEELSVIGYSTNHLIHIVCLVWIVWDNLVQSIVHAVDRVCALYAWSLFCIVARDVREQAFDHLDSLFLSLSSEVGYTTLGCVNRCTTEVLCIDVLTSYGLDNLRTSQEHIRSLLLHDDEVGQTWRVNGTTGARAHDSRNLWDDTRSEDVALENLTVTSEGADTFLNTSTTRIVHADNRCTHSHSHIHYLADLLCHSLRE